MSYCFLPDLVLELLTRNIGINNEIKGWGSAEFWRGPSKHVLLL